MFISFHVYIGIRMGFQPAGYTAVESVGSVLVCAAILNRGGCIASKALTFILTVRTSDDSAGMYILLYSL